MEINALKCRFSKGNGVGISLLKVLCEMGREMEDFTANPVHTF